MTIRTDKIPPAGDRPSSGGRRTGGQPSVLPYSGCSLTDCRSKESEAWPFAGVLPGDRRTRQRNEPGETHVNAGLQIR